MPTPNENITNVRHEPHIYFVDDIPESLLKQALVTGNATDIENYLNGNPVLFLKEREHLKEIEALSLTTL